MRLWECKWKQSSKQAEELQVSHNIPISEYSEIVPIEYICFKILKLKTLYKLSIMLILFKITTARILILKNYL